MMEIKKKIVNILPRELPPSSYEVIHLPTLPNKSQLTKESPLQKLGVKRQKVMPLVTSQETTQPNDFRSMLNAKCPSFTKTLMKSQVSGGFWMGLQPSFCRMHLPLVDTSFLLEYENGKQYKVKYLAERTAFSAGWKEFSLVEKFSEGDVLVFQLENKTKFKVHKVKQSGLSEENGAHVTLNMDASVERNGTYATALEKSNDKHRASSSEAVPRDEDREVDDELVQKGMPSVTSHADEFHSTLNAKGPSFTKTLVKSHVSGSYSMGLPRSFCRTYLPSVDTYIILENENGKRYMVKYLAEITAFSSRWRDFYLGEKLSEGDVLLFQLLGAKRFKVHKVKENGLSEENGAPFTLNSDARMERNCTYDTALDKSKEKHRAFSSEAVSQDEDHIMIPSEDVEIAGNGKTNTPELNSGKSKHLQFPPIVGDCNDITTFDNFAITLDKLVNQDYKLPYHIKWSYYQLCSSQKSVLHADLLKGTNPIFVAGCIIETVDIANALKSCELLAFDNNFAIWDQKLKSLEVLGMNVRFLSARLLHLKTIACNSEAAKTKQKYQDMCSERADIENMINSLQDKLTELRKVSEKRADDIEKLNTEMKERERRFQEQVSAQW